MSQAEVGVGGRFGAAVLIAVVASFLAACGPEVAMDALTEAPRPAPVVAPEVAAAPPTSTTSTTPPPTTSTITAPTGRTIRTAVTFYAAYDNDPPGSTEIAYPQLHDAAGGRGTHADPLTFATHRDEIVPGTRIYVPSLRKYFLMEDSCEACENEWEADRTRHIDLYAGGATDPGVLACEDTLTPSGAVTVELDPPPGRPVDTTPFYADGQCLST